MKPPPRFKLGERVRVARVRQRLDEHFVGGVGRIREVDDHQSPKKRWARYEVQLDNGDRWSFAEDELELA